jgi:hypothetical protein
VSACVQDAVCRCLIDIAAGMDYLHSLGVLHGEDLFLIPFRATMLFAGLSLYNQCDPLVCDVLSAGLFFVIWLIFRDLYLIKWLVGLLSLQAT